MRGMRDYAGSVMRNLSSVIIARGDRRTSRPTCFERGSLANDRENFLVYEICVEEGLFGGGLVCSWPIWRKVRIPFVGKLETYIERAVYLPGLAYVK